MPSLNNTPSWKAATLFLAILLIASHAFFFLKNSQFHSISDEKTPASVPSPTPQVPGDTPLPKSLQSFEYPTDKAWINKRGVAKIQLANNPVQNDSFTLSLQRNPDGAQIFKEKKYKIPLLGMDYVSSPTVSYKEKYACVTIGGSGYVGYYIFTLPDGNKIDQGTQYSECVNWINDHQVIIVENEYGKPEVTYSIFDAETKTKKVISKFAQ